MKSLANAEAGADRAVQSTTRQLGPTARAVDAKGFYAFGAPPIIADQWQLFLS